MRHKSVPNKGVQNSQQPLSSEDGTVQVHQKNPGEGACLKTDHDAIRHNNQADERLQVGQQADLVCDPAFGYPISQTMNPKP